MSQAALRELAADPSSRKRFLSMVGGTGAAGAFALLLGACGGEDDEGAQDVAGDDGTSDADAINDLAIVNYALTLEYLEADFYGRVIDSGVLDDRPAVAELAERFGQTEREHATALETTARMLGDPVERPQTTFDDVIEAGPAAVLRAAADVENLGAAAYLGQATAIRSREILAAALAIHTVEARHAAALNELIDRDFTESADLSGSVPDGAFAKPMTMEQVLRAVEPFLVS